MRALYHTVCKQTSVSDKVQIIYTCVFVVVICFSCRGCVHHSDDNILLSLLPEVNVSAVFHTGLLLVVTLKHLPKVEMCFSHILHWLHTPVSFIMKHTCDSFCFLIIARPKCVSLTGLLPGSGQYLRLLPAAPAGWFFCSPPRSCV